MIGFYNNDEHKLGIVGNFPPHQVPVLRGGSASRSAQLKQMPNPLQLFEALGRAQTSSI